MKYLKNKHVWESWKKEEYLSDYEAECPKEYPCFTYLVVGSFPYEEYDAYYLYKQDIERMLLEVEAK